MKKFTILTVSVTVLCLVVQCVRSQANIPLSPCPRIFWYENDGQTWYGIIELGPPYQKDLVLNVEMDIGISLPTSYVGRIELLGQRSHLIVNIVNKRKIKYQVHFPVLDTVPVITKIIYNNRVVCNGPHLNANIVTSINLKHVLNTNLENTNFNNYGNSYDNGQDNTQNAYEDSVRKTGSENQMQPGGSVYFEDDRKQGTTEMQPWLSYTEQYKPQPARTVSQQQRQGSNQKNPSQNSAYNREDRPNPDTFATFYKKPTEPPVVSKVPSYVERDQVGKICGVPRNVNPLIIGGESTRKGDWPWLVAIFVKKVSSLNFICGATLISTDTIITAAHCMLEKNNRPVKKEEIIVKLGTFNLQDWTDEDAKTLAVREIISHPSYDGGLGLRNDIAILKVNKVNFTNYILPSCLWTENLNSDSYVGKYGVTIGWGRDEKGLLASPEPRMSRQKLVSLDECRESNTAFVFLTSNTTFCAGNRDGTGPCNGDSGGGMFLYINGQWRLKGIVSSSLSDPSSQNVCDLSYFVIYTDVNKFLDWINIYL